MSYKEELMARMEASRARLTKALFVFQYIQVDKDKAQEISNVLCSIERATQRLMTLEEELYGEQI